MMLRLLVTLMAKSGVITFTPLSFFANGEQGAWYDPSDLTTMFQDAAGTTPVTAAEQPVGLILDKSKGLVLGAELVVNGDMSSATGWAFNAGTGTATISGGVASVNSIDGSFVSIFASPQVTIAVNKSYLVSFEVTAISGGGVRVDMGGSTGTAFTTTGQKSTILAVTNALAALSIVRGGGISGGSIDNISVRELPGNHATQTTATKRPVLSARVNLLTKTEDFADAAWGKISSTVTGNTSIAPDGTMTADTLAVAAGGAGRASVPSTAGALMSLSVWAKKSITGGASAIQITTNNTSAWNTGISQKFSLTDSWQRLTISGVGISSGTNMFCIFGALNVAGAADATCIGNVDIWGASLVPADQADLPYQRVNTATDYDTVGFPHYLKFDGIDDALVTGSIDFTATDKMTVVAGVRKLSDAANGAIVGLSSSPGGSTGTFELLLPYYLNGGFTGPGFISRGTASSNVSAANTTAPITSVLSSIAAISTDINTFRVNGVSGANASTDQGTGNFGNYPLYIGSRGGTSLPFNGHLYSLIVRGAQSTDAQITSAETWVNGKTGAY